LLPEFVIASEVFIRFCGVIDYLHQNSCFLPCLNIFEPLNFHSINPINSIDSLILLHSYRFCQIAGFVRVASSIDSEIISQELKGNYGDHRIE
jgi:hypothetical protein